MAFPLEDLPVDHFQGAGKLSENESDCLRNLMNRMRKASEFNGYQVDPNDSDKYATLAAAWAVADVAEADGAVIKFVLADGTYSDNVDFGNDHPIVIESVNYGGAIITGDLTFGASAARLQRQIKNGMLDGNTIYIEDGCNLEIDNCYGDEYELNLDPSAGTVGYEVVVRNGYTKNLKIIETAASTGTRKVYIRGGTLSFSASSAIPVSIYNLKLYFHGISGDSWWHLGANSIFDLNNVAGSIYFFNVSAPIISNATADVFINAGSATVEFLNTNFYAANGQSLMLGSTFGTVRGSLKLWDEYEPTNPIPGMTWEDPALDDTLVWDGTYWGNGTIYRKDLLVDVGSAAVSHTSGWTVPTGAGVLNVSANAVKALTGASGATLYGISDGSDGDKYAESAALVKNSKAGAKQASINVGSGDTIYVHSMTSTGTEGGTLAGSNDADVRVVVYFTMPKTLPTV